MDDFERDVVGHYESLRRFAHSLCGTADQADDLVQDTLYKALRYRYTFSPGTNLKAWLSTILRNHFFTEMQKRRAETAHCDNLYTAEATAPSQMTHIEYEEMCLGLGELKPDERELLILACVEQMPYGDIAAKYGVEVGTIKSRVSRARKKLKRTCTINLAQPARAAARSPMRSPSS